MGSQASGDLQLKKKVSPEYRPVEIWMDLETVLQNEVKRKTRIVY